MYNSKGNIEIEKDKEEEKIEPLPESFDPYGSIGEIRCI